MKQIISILAIAAMAATSCNRATSKEKEAAIALQMEIARQQVLDSINEATASAATAAAAAKAQAASSARKTDTRTIYVNTSSQPAANNQPATVVSEQPATEQQKKGWSAKAKGAVIG